MPGPPETHRIAGNPPYLLTGPLLERATMLVDHVDRVVFMVLILFILIALFAITVAYVVGAAKRRIEPALIGWGAALLFALPALRNAMPGAPPIGAWIDILVFLWVIVIAVISYLVVVSTWVRKSAPPEKK